MYVHIYAYTYTYTHIFMYIYLYIHIYTVYMYNYLFFLFFLLIYLLGHGSDPTHFPNLLLIFHLGGEGDWKYSRCTPVRSKTGRLESYLAPGFIKCYVLKISEFQK
jgi:hypothetical protein